MGVLPLPPFGFFCKATHKVGLLRGVLKTDSAILVTRLSGANTSKLLGLKDADRETNALTQHGEK